ncbi:MAG: ATP-binding cassette domain-containing protein [Actinobacteria bacterium]|nr:ATP-binding cassette domain-containing protein [Actinomycetota bacterium]
MAQKLILENVSYSYPFSGAPSVLKDVNLLVEPGQVICIAGRNGSGKSTLAQVCAGLLNPSKGKLTYGDEPIRNKRDVPRLRKNVCLLFQSPEEQLFADTVLADISFGPRNHGIKGPELLATVNKSAEMAGLDMKKLENRSPFSLSGGEKRMVALAGVFALKPGILVLDEPFTGLDYEHREHLRQSLIRYRESRNASLVIISHELSNVWPIADKFGLLSDGTLSGLRSRTEVITEEDGISRLGLRLPQWGELEHELRKLDIEVDEPSDHRLIAATIRSYCEGLND